MTYAAPWWVIRLTAVLGIKLNQQTIRFFLAWHQAEGGDAKNNWLNTTYVLPWGSTPYNHLSSGGGVQNYAQPVAGVCATALTLATSHSSAGTLTFGHLLGDLQGGAYTAEQVVERNRAQITTWGTNTDTILRELAGMPA